MRSRTPTTNPLAGFRRVQEKVQRSQFQILTLGFTTRLYDRRKARPEDSPTFKVKY